MHGEFLDLGALVARAQIDDSSAIAQQTIDQGIRASLLCTLLGVEREQWVWPFSAAARNADARPSSVVRMLAGLLEPLGGIAHLGTLAAASDLDPMDPGPSHTVLPATLASCVVHSMFNEADPSAATADDSIASAVLAGVEAAWRFRRAVTGARPGVGFHSPGVFGALAAAASASRALRLDAAACTDALAIALTRASGLAINSAASMIGMTHFGWGAAHGLEAALLASQGWGASQDFRRALATLFGEEQISIEQLKTPGPSAAEALVFKRYPCNIYLNLLVSMLDEVQGGPVERIEAALPWVPHLDCPAPKDLRQARNSAQAVAAIAGVGDTSYAAFSGPPGPWVPSEAVARLLPNIQLHMDRNAPTGLKNAVLSVKVWRGGSIVHEGERAMRELKGWGIEHAHRLMGPEGGAGVDALYKASYSNAFEHVRGRLRSSSVLSR